MQGLHGRVFLAVAVAMVAGGAEDSGFHELEFTSTVVVRLFGRIRFNEFAGAFDLVAAAPDRQLVEQRLVFLEIYLL